MLTFTSEESSNFSVLFVSAYFCFIPFCLSLNSCIPNSAIISRIALSPPLATVAFLPILTNFRGLSVWGLSASSFNNLAFSDNTLLLLPSLSFLFNASCVLLNAWFALNLSCSSTRLLLLSYLVFSTPVSLEITLPLLLKSNGVSRVNRLSYFEANLPLLSITVLMSLF